MKYIKKPVEVEALQFNGEHSFCHMLNTWGERFDVASEYEDGKDDMFVKTQHGRAYLDKGDWVIRGVDGEFYPCRESIFALTYEPAKEYCPKHVRVMERPIPVGECDQCLADSTFQDTRKD